MGRSDWKEVKLEEICIKIGSGATPRGGSNVYMETGEISLIRSQNIYNNEFKEDGLVYITEEAADKLSNVDVKTDDVLINITGDSVARVCKPNVSVLPARVNQHVSILRPDIEKLDSNYLQCSLVSPTKQKMLLTLSEAGATRKALTKGMLESFRINLPPLSEQKAIAHILGSLDDKIELNRQMNKTLEEMAQAMFKSWFVDFDPVFDNAIKNKKDVPEELREKLEKRKNVKNKKPLPKDIQDLFPDEFEFTEEMGWVPKGWAVSSFRQECDFQNGYAFKSKELIDEPELGYPVFKMGHIQRGGGFNYEGTKSYFPKERIEEVEKYILRKGDILIAMTDMKSNMAILGHTALMSVNEKFVQNQRVGKLSLKKSSYLDYPYIFILSNHHKTIERQRKKANSGVQVNLTTEGIKDTVILRPSEKIHDIFNKVAKSLLENIFCKENENRDLTSIRDTLLPKLVSGEVRLDSKVIDKILEETDG